MIVTAPLPSELSQLAERETWFSHTDAGRVLDWLESKGARLLGVETARKQSDGKWELLLDPMLDLSSEGDAATTVRQGRDFIARYSDPALMFEPVWTDD